MSDIQLYINHQLADLEPATIITITKQINDFGELDNRQSTYTNQMTLPMTFNNKNIAKQLGVVGNQSDIFKRKVHIRLVVKGNTIIANGIGLFKKTDIVRQKYSLTIYDGNKQFFQAIENKKINELIWDSFNHELTESNFTGSFTNDYADGYIYGIADFGNYKESKIEINFQTPSVFVKAIWDKVFAFAGFTPDWSPATDLVLTAKRGWDSVIDNTSASWSYDSPTTNHYENPNGYQIVLINDTQPNLQNGRYYIRNTQNYHIQFDLSIITDLAHLQSLIIYREDADGIVTIIDEILPTINSQDDYSGNYNVGYNRTVTLSDGDIVDFYMKLELIEDPNQDDYVEPDPPTIDVDNNIKFETVTSSVANVSIATLLGEMSAHDFIKSMLKMQGMLMETDPVTKNVRFIKAKDMLKLSNAVDWSDKFLKVIDEDAMLKNYGEQSVFEYKYFSKDVYPFADGIMNIDNDTITGKKTVVKLPYNATEKSVNTLNSEKLQFIPLWEAKRDDTGAITKWEAKNKNNAICRVVTKNGTIHYGTHQGTTQDYTGDYPILDFTGLNWNTLITDNYQEINKLLNWNKKLNIEILIDAQTFNSIDLFKLVYFKQLGAYFYVNKIKLKSNKDTTVGEFIYVNL